MRTLVGIMNQPKAQPAARVAAAQVILDRGWGRPEQRVEGEVNIRIGIPSFDVLVDAAWEEVHGEKPPALSGPTKPGNGKVIQ